jgi:hypothetical protein
MPVEDSAPQAPLVWRRFADPEKSLTLPAGEEQPHRRFEEIRNRDLFWPFSVVVSSVAGKETNQWGRADMLWRNWVAQSGEGRLLTHPGGQYTRRSWWPADCTGELRQGYFLVMTTDLPR